MDDIKIQVHAVTSKALSELHKRFPNSEFDLILRDFASAIHIQLRKTQISAMIKSIASLVTEDFGLDTPSAQGTLLYLNGYKLNYEGTLALLKDLKETPILTELIHLCTYDNLIPWIKNTNGHNELYSILQNKYPHLFTHLDYKTTTTEIQTALKSAIERKYRSDTINHYIRNCHTIEEKLLGVQEWQANHSESWFKQIHEFMPELTVRGFQKITVTEIVPKGLSSYVGIIGGKTIKIGKYQDLEHEFTLSTRDALGDFALEIDASKLQNIKSSLLRMTIARRYIFPEAIERILELENSERGYKIKDLNLQDPKVREFIYGVFVNDSQAFLYNMEETFKMIRPD